MDLQQENDRMLFLEFCESSLKNAYSMGFLCVEGLNSKNLTEEERIRGASFKNEDVVNQLKTLDRPDYVSYRRFPGMLYELFKSLGYLSNREEMDKLQQAMILGEIFVEVTMILLKDVLTKNPAEGMKNDSSSSSTFSQEELAVNQVLCKIHKRVSLVSAPSTIDDLTRLLACHDWSMVNKKLYCGCPTNVLKCVVDCYKPFNPDLTYANLERSGFLISKKSRRISAHNLSTTNYQKLRIRVWIENTMAQCLKNH